LNKLYKELTEIEEKMREKEKQAKQVEREAPETKLSERQKRMEISREKKVKGHSKLSSKKFVTARQNSRRTKDTKKNKRVISKKGKARSH
jgi:hypothetical protein